MFSYSLSDENWWFFSFSFCIIIVRLLSDVSEIILVVHDVSGPTCCLDRFCFLLLRDSQSSDRKWPCEAFQNKKIKHSVNQTNPCLDRMWLNEWTCRSACCRGKGTGSLPWCWRSFLVKRHPQKETPSSPWQPRLAWRPRLFVIVEFFKNDFFFLLVAAAPCSILRTEDCSGEMTSSDRRVMTSYNNLSQFHEADTHQQWHSSNVNHVRRVCALS